MKLEFLRSTMMVTSTLFLLLGCKPKSGYDQLVSRMDSAASVKSTYVIHSKGQKDVTIQFLFSKPGRYLATSNDFVVATNEVDGHFESVLNDQMYDALPWDGRNFPGTGSLVPTQFFEAGPGSANNPQKFAPKTPWKLKETINGVETYTKTIESMMGPQTFTLMVKTDGTPYKFIAPGDVVYEVTSFECSGELPVDQFRVEPKEGFVCYRTATTDFHLVDGETFDWTKFQAADNVKSFKADGLTLFAIVDPAESSSQNALTWLKKAGMGYAKVSISKGAATSGFFDSDGKLIDKLTMTTPAFALVNKDRKIIGLWMGFDPEGTAAFEADIKKAIDDRDEKS